MSTETDEKVVATEVKAGELLADTDKDLVGSSVMISYSRKGRDAHAVAIATLSMANSPRAEASRRMRRRRTSSCSEQALLVHNQRVRIGCALKRSFRLCAMARVSVRTAVKAFVKNIYDALAVDDRNIWVDWEVRRMAVR